MTESRHAHGANDLVQPYFLQANQIYHESDESYDCEDDSSETSSDEEVSDDGEDCSDESSLTDYHPSEKVKTYFNN